MEGGHAMVVARMKFEKGENVRYISHLDLQRTFQRALRRAEIDITYSQGFNPHPKISFAMAVPVGMTSEGEYIDVELNSFIEENQLLNKLNQSLPTGLKILDCKISIKSHPSLMSIIEKGIYRVTIKVKQPIQLEQIKKRMLDFLTQEEIYIEKRDKKGRIKEKDIRPFINEFLIEKIERQSIYFRMILAAGSHNNIKPERVIQKFSHFGDYFLEYDRLKIHRIDLLARDGDQFVSPIKLFT